MTTRRARSIVMLIVLGACTGPERDATPRPAMRDSSKAAAAGEPVVALSPSYLGLRDDSLPPEVKKESGFALGVAGRRARVAAGGADPGTFALVVVRTPWGKRVWLDSLTGHVDAEKRRPLWRVHAELALPPLAANQVLSVGTCQLDGRVDEELVAIVEDGDTALLTRVHRAWRAERRTQRFHPAFVTGIACENEGYGI